MFTDAEVTCSAKIYLILKSAKAPSGYDFSLSIRHSPTMS
jgi:hypothetical protein